MRCQRCKLDLEPEKFSAYVRQTGQGRCRACQSVAVRSSRELHREAYNRQERDRYRAARGIPLDAPHHCDHVYRAALRALCRTAEPRTEGPLASFLP